MAFVFTDLPPRCPLILTSGTSAVLNGHRQTQSACQAQMLPTAHGLFLSLSSASWLLRIIGCQPFWGRFDFLVEAILGSKDSTPNASPRGNFGLVLANPSCLRQLSGKKAVTERCVPS